MKLRGTADRSALAPPTFFRSFPVYVRSISCWPRPSPPSPCSPSPDRPRPLPWRAGAEARRESRGHSRVTGDCLVRHWRTSGRAAQGTQRASLYSEVIVTGRGFRQGCGLETQRLLSATEPRVYTEPPATAGGRGTLVTEQPEERTVQGAVKGREHGNTTSLFALGRGNEVSKQLTRSPKRAVG